MGFANVHNYLMEQNERIIQETHSLQLAAGKLVNNISLADPKCAGILHVFTLTLHNMHAQKIIMV